MSLDVYLDLATPVPPTTGRIFIREGGMVSGISRDEWDRRFPGIEPVTIDMEHESTYTVNIARESTNGP